MLRSSRRSSGIRRKFKGCSEVSEIFTSQVNDNPAQKQAVYDVESSMRIFGIEPPEPFSMPGELEAALEEALKGRSLIKESQEPLRELMALASNEVEKNARAYQIDLVEWQLTRAADLADKRIIHIKTIQSDTRAREENERCAKDVAYWFEMYAWGIDPRPDAPLSVMPFALFKFQERYVNWLNKITFHHRVSGLTEKCRDMGATETFLRWMWHNWKYRPAYIGMTLSANEDLVDSKKDPSTLFEKLRFQTRMVPPWMLPVGFIPDRDMPFMMMENPENRSVIIGDAPTSNVGRQRRATNVLGDEYATWPFGGYPQYSALSRTELRGIAAGKGAQECFGAACFDHLGRDG